jgi:CHAT domain-containing protein
VLSRVQADEGPREPGAGVIGLWWAWLVAGAPSTITSRWLTDQASTAALAASLDAALMSGPSRSARRPSEALRRSVLAMMKGGFAHPDFWARMTVMGDVD